MQRRRVFFVHVPKTGGVALMSVMKRAFGQENVLDFVDDPARVQAGEGLVYSGHHRLGDVLEVCDRSWFLFTSVREPVRQLASHLQWADHYNDLGFEMEREQFRPAVIEVFDRLRETDFLDAGAVDTFLTELPFDSAIRFRNVQSEMLAFSSQSIRPMDDRTQADLAIAHLHTLSFVCRLETIQEDVDRLMNGLGCRNRYEIIAENTGDYGRRVNLADPAMVSMLRRHIGADERLYEHINSARFR